MRHKFVTTVAKSVYKRINEPFILLKALSSTIFITLSMLYESIPG